MNTPLRTTSEIATDLNPSIRTKYGQVDLDILCDR
jgi:hypothetical protein